jgi:transcriptional regulator with XRE-family HTH domain
VVDEDGDVGIRLREARQARGLTLKQTARRAEISEGFLSQIERGVASASIATLRRIAVALGLRMSDLFDPGWVPGPRVLTRAERPSLHFGVFGRKFLLTPSPGRNLEAFIGEFEPGGSTGDEAYVHGDSDELMLILGGRVRLELGDQLFDLDHGDSIEYRSSVPHRVLAASDQAAEVLWIISPPSY